MPVLIGEHVRGLEPKADLVVAKGTDLLRSDLEYDLGITGAMKIAHLGEDARDGRGDPRVLG
jgi:L-alanine-DL-glutamate epimerase-like enolase superfamily enzyme